MAKITWSNLDELLIPVLVLALGLAAPQAVAADVKARPGASTQALEPEVKEWLEIYAFVSPGELSALQKAGCLTYVRKKLKGTSSGPYRAIASVWPSIRKTVRGNEVQRKNFQNLLRALLRAQQRSAKIAHQKTKDNSYLDDVNFISQLLGPLRVAVPGNPSLTEDAVDAYADMACFLYEKNNPGKTVDSLENRLLFTRVISSKFEDAPDEKAKKAMADFDLTWSRFRICWDEADENTRKQLVQIWSKKGDTKYGIISNNPELDSLLKKTISTGPWQAGL